MTRCFACGGPVLSDDTRCAECRGEGVRPVCTAPGCVVRLSYSDPAGLCRKHSGEGTMRLCAVPGCNIQLATQNRNGYCAAHKRLSPQWVEAKNRATRLAYMAGRRR